VNDDLAATLARFAPSVDTTEAHRAFRATIARRRRSTRLVGSGVAAALIVVLIVVLVIVTHGGDQPDAPIDTPPSPVSVTESATTLAPPTTTRAVAEPEPTTTEPELATTLAPATTIEAAFGEIAPIADAAILALPSPMPDGWVVSGVLGGLYDDDGQRLGELDSSPLADNTSRTLTVWLVRSDGTAVARFVAEEYPTSPVPVTMPPGLTVPGVDTVQIGGRDVAHRAQTLDDSPLRLPGYSTIEGWSWTIDGRNLSLEVQGDTTDGVDLVAATRPVSGAEMNAAITAGQQAMSAWPALATATAPDGARLSAHSTGSVVAALCATSPGDVVPAITVCSSIGQQYHEAGVTGVALAVAATGNGPRNAAWLPPAFASPLAPGPVVLAAGRLGSFAYDFNELSTVGTDPASGAQMFSGFALQFRNLLGLPRVDP